MVCEEADLKTTATSERNTPKWLQKSGEKMKKKILLVIFAVFIFGHIPVVSAEMTAEQVIAKSWQLYRQAKDEVEEVKVMVAHEDGRTEKKSLTRWTKFDPSGKDKTVIKFTEPAMDKGLGLLIWRNPGGADDMWLKIPSVKNERKISVSDESKYFGGTDLTFEDIKMLSGEKTSDYNYQFLPEGKERIIIATPKIETKSKYAKRRIYILPGYGIYQINCYDKNNNFIKAIINNNINLGENGIWRPRVVMVDNKKLKRSTVLEIKRKLDSGLSNSKFTKDFLIGER